MDEVIDSTIDGLVSAIIDECNENIRKSGEDVKDQGLKPSLGAVRPQHSALTVACNDGFRRTALSRVESKDTPSGSTICISKSERSARTSTQSLIRPTKVSGVREPLVFEKDARAGARKNGIACDFKVRYAEWNNSGKESVV